MTNSYSLTVINESELTSPTFAVFAQLPGTSDYDTLSLAWLTQQIDSSNQIDSTNQYVFTWDIEWGFAWTAHGTAENHQWTGSGKLPANPLSATGCQAELSYNGDFHLQPGQATPDGSTLWIVDDPTVPLPSKQPSSVAVTLSGSPACVTNAGPNLHQTFTLHPTYFIDAGAYVKGQMVDGTSVTGFQELAYEKGVTALTATLQEDNTWEVVPSTEVDFVDRLSCNCDGDDGDVGAGGGKLTGVCHSRRGCEGKVFSRKATMKGCEKLTGKSWKPARRPCQNL
jgi:rhizosphere induced protein